MLQLPILKSQRQLLIIYMDTHLHISYRKSRIPCHFPLVVTKCLYFTQTEVNNKVRSWLEIKRSFSVIKEGLLVSRHCVSFVVFHTLAIFEPTSLVNFFRNSAVLNRNYVTVLCGSVRRASMNSHRMVILYITWLKMINNKMVWN